MIQGLADRFGALEDRVGRSVDSLTAKLAIQEGKMRFVERRLEVRLLIFVCIEHRD